MCEEKNKLDKFLSHNKENYHIVTIGKYGEYILGEFLDKTENKYGAISKKVNIILKNEIENYLNIDKEEYLFVLGDMEESGTKDIIEKIVVKREKITFLILKNYNNRKTANNVNIVNIQQENDIYSSLEVLLYQIFYPSILTSDYKDLLKLLNDNNNIIETKSIENGTADLKNIIKEINASKVIGIEICVGKEVELADINNIVKYFQDNMFNSIAILYHDIHSKDNENKDVKISLLYC